MELRPPTPTDKASLEYLRMKLRNAAFFVNGVDIEKLFRHYDLDNNGILDVDEFTQALRKDCDMSEVGGPSPRLCNDLPNTCLTALPL